MENKIKLSKSNIIGVSFNIPLPPLSYLVENKLIQNISIGKRVIAPLRNKPRIGIITETNSTSIGKNLEHISQIVDTEPLFDEQMMQFFKWISNYYHYPIGKIIISATPQKLFNNPVLKYKIINRSSPLIYRLPNIITHKYVKEKLQGEIELLMREGVVEQFYDSKIFNLDPIINENDENNDITCNDSPTLSVHQQSAYSKISTAIKNNRHKIFHLFGVTGSGKTEVYIQAIKDVLAQGKSAIVVVPEISLTPQLVARFRCRFGCLISVLHSNLKDSERNKTWLLIKQNRIKIVIGARSAIFAPFNNLGIIVVDEEHDSSFKQESLLPYNGRDIACVRGKIYGIPVILGSATPSIETYYNCENKKYELLTLPERVTKHNLPSVTLVDMRKETPLFGEKRFISEKLEQELSCNLNKNEKTILFLNRRGFSTFVICERCGEIEKCANCSVSLTYHKNGDSLICHYCSYNKKFTNMCQSCGTLALAKLGLGTQKVEDELKMLFPEAVVCRMDSDVTKKSMSHETIFDRLTKGEIDILIGTQMVTKGLDIPDVTLVGVLNADCALNMPDFRSSEKTFQLITQVAGRAGRGEHPGRVIVQTYNPEHYSVILGAKQDYISFYENEKKFRNELFYPPFSKIVLVRIIGKDIKKVEGYAKEFAKKILVVKAKLNYTSVFQILGPAPCPISKIKEKERWQILIKAKNYSDLHLLFTELEKNIKRGERQIKITIDFDPQNFM